MVKLGQHFLTSRAVAQKIVGAAEIGPKDIVLEIGPGKGILTEELLKRAKKVIAIEKDFEFFKLLNQKFSESVKLKKLALINADIRDFLKIPTNVKHRMFDKVVANIPYYLTGQLLRLLLPITGIESLYLMVQKEVAKRIMANLSGKSRALAKMNLLAISVRVFAEPKIAFYVKRDNFRPQPKVDSAVIILKKREKDFFRERKISQKTFFEVVKTGFAHKRKLLKNNLKMSNIQCWTKCGIAENARAEDLSLENWACVAKSISDIHRKK